MPRTSTQPRLPVVGAEKPARRVLKTVEEFRTYLRKLDGVELDRLQDALDDSTLGAFSFEVSTTLSYSDLVQTLLEVNADRVGDSVRVQAGRFVVTNACGLPLREYKSSPTRYSVSGKLARSKAPSKVLAYEQRDGDDSELPGAFIVEYDKAADRYEVKDRDGRTVAGWHAGMVR